VKPIVIIEQDPPLVGGGLVQRVAEARGLPLRIVQAFDGGLADVDLDEVSALVPMGGSQHAWDEEGHPYLGDERRLLAAAHARDIPILGICLGGQVLARALGAEVRATERPERGMYDVEVLASAADDPVLGPAGPGGRVYQWHLDVFDLPDGATLLARSPATEVQAFRHGTAWGLQFHPEVDDAILRFWLSNFPDACEEAGVDEAALRREVAEREPDATTTFAARLVDAFLSVAAGRAGRPGAPPAAPCGAPAGP
jgi:GMP synthase (glutamine-hydrolysing)